MFSKLRNRHLYLAPRARWEEFMRQNLPPYALEHLDPALEGDSDAAASLCSAAPNCYRGLLAVFFSSHGPINSFREILANAWELDHREVIAAIGTKRGLEEMFRKASFEPPAEMPELVTLYRGTSALPFSAAKCGCSWTTDKKVAAFFAMRFAGSNGQPLVLRATVPKNAIVFYSNERSEREAVCFHVRGAKIDGNPEEWEELMEQFQQEKRQSQEAWMKELKSQSQPESDNVSNH